MTDLAPLFPRQPVPALALPLAGGGTFDLGTERPKAFTLLVFYRGLHCPICKTQLRDLESQLDAFRERGVGIVAISSDTQARAQQAKADWGLPNLRVAYGLDLETARSWGLFISSGRAPTSVGVEEPALFSEPGLFLVRPDGTLYFGSVQTMPFARPPFADILSGIDFVASKNYPARGEVSSLPRAA